MQRPYMPNQDAPPKTTKIGGGIYNKQNNTDDEDEY